MTIKRAIILAAGQGRRLWPWTEDLPKCLLPVGPRTVLEHQLEALSAVRIADITVVTGYLQEKIRSVVGERVGYIHNPRYGETSSMYSLWLAREKAEEGCLILNGDVLFHSDILRNLLSVDADDALAVDFDAELAEEEMKVVVQENLVRALSKNLKEADGENVGMLKFGVEGTRALFATMEKMLAQGDEREMVPFAVSVLAQTYPIMAVPVDGRAWIEIDYSADLQQARKVVYPAIQRDLPAKPPSFPSFTSRYTPGRP